MPESPTLESKLQALVAEWPHDLRKLSGDHDGTEKRHCRRCQLEALLAERQEPPESADDVQVRLDRVADKVVAGIHESYRLRKVLSEHWLSEIHCHHAVSPDDSTYDWASCACSQVNLPHQATVGEAVGTWIEHVISILAAAEPSSGTGEKK